MGKWKTFPSQGKKKQRVSSFSMFYGENFVDDANIYIFAYIFCGRMESRIKEILTQRGITMKDFAAQAGISESNLGNHLNGNISPTLDTLNMIAGSLGVDVRELFKKKGNMELYAKYNGVLCPMPKMAL